MTAGYNLFLVSLHGSLCILVPYQQWPVRDSHWRDVGCGLIDVGIDATQLMAAYGRVVRVLLYFGERCFVLVSVKRAVAEEIVRSPRHTIGVGLEARNEGSVNVKKN